MTDDGARLDAAVDIVEISQLVLAEREAVSRAWWELAADCYDDAAVIHLPDYVGNVDDYIHQRRLQRHNGRRVHWSLGTPVVYLHHRRAVATTDASADLISIEGQIETTVRVALLLCVQRKHQAWRLASLETSLQAVEVLAVPTGTWPVLPTTSIIPQVIFGVGLHRLDPKIAIAEDPATQRRFREALAWADLRPGPSDSPAQD